MESRTPEAESRKLLDDWEELITNIKDMITDDLIASLETKPRPNGDLGFSELKTTTLKNWNTVRESAAIISTSPLFNPHDHSKEMSESVKCFRKFEKDIHDPDALSLVWFMSAHNLTEAIHTISTKVNTSKGKSSI